MNAMHIILIAAIVIALVAFEFAAWHWGYDSRDGFCSNKFNDNPTRHHGRSGGESTIAEAAAAQSVARS
jgi:hypothetical protein